MNAGKATTPRVSRTYRSAFPPEQTALADRETQRALARKSSSAFSGKSLPTESDCKPLFRYLNGQCPFDDPQSPDAAAGNAMLEYCMKTYGSLDALRQVMSDYPFTLKVRLLDCADGSAVLGELAKGDIPCDVEAAIGDDRPHAEEHLAAFLRDARCKVRTLTVHCANTLAQEKVEPLVEALASCSSLKNFELVAMDAPRAVTMLFEAVKRKPLESLTVVGNFTLVGGKGYQRLIQACMKIPSVKVCLDLVSCGYLLSMLTIKQRRGWELQLCEWDARPADRSSLQRAANNMLEYSKDMTHAGFALFSPLGLDDKLTLKKGSALLTFNTLITPNARPDCLPADLRSLFVGIPEGEDVLRMKLAPELARNRAKHFAFSEEGFVPGALSGVALAVAIANGIPADVATHVGPHIAGAGRVCRQDALQYALVSKVSLRAAARERDQAFLNWLVTAWRLHRVNPKDVAVGLASTPLRLSSAFRDLAVKKLGEPQGKELADAMAPITNAPEQIDPKDLV